LKELVPTDPNHLHILHNLSPLSENIQYDALYTQSKIASYQHPSCQSYTFFLYIWVRIVNLSEYIQKKECGLICLSLLLSSPLSAAGNGWGLNPPALSIT